MSIALDDIQTFLLLYKYRDISSVAREMNVSDGTIKYRIRTIEHFLKRKLVESMGSKNVKFTEFGEFTAGEFKKIMNIIDGLNKYNNKLINEIKIGSGEVAGIYFLPRLAKEFKDKFPSFKISFEIVSTLDVFEMLQNREADIGFVASLNFDDIDEFLNDVNVIKLKRIKLVVISKKGTLTSKRIKVHDVLHLPYIGRKPNSGIQAEVRRILNREGFSESDLKMVYRLDNSSSVISAVIEGLGVSIVSYIQAERYIEAGLLDYAELETDVESYLYIIDSWKGKNSLVNTFIDFTRKFISDKDNVNN
ncbi:hypothetical protein L3N51_02220 [Metallosphaera sp. J1]|uniref:LysR family transcriptional regulator n=1 Tax=Metallosphaera javensis (ex Hofmann et al. 2022) TaxID=99938 RepID=UPI001EDF7A0B|nr:LysR family transcriptional regulator [Metallosphaera javensis (ex Hofmann et al. 2022)]MCG3109923.1 hypothetical protein [Metallosphaera javensis (ex Hofmann et al. 2022)]